MLRSPTGGVLLEAHEKRRMATHPVHRTDFEVRWRRRVQRGFGLSFISVALVAAVFGPLDHPGEAILFALATLAFGVFMGLSWGRSQRRDLPYRGRGPRISQSSSAAGSAYQSFDVTEEPFEVQKTDVEPLALLSIWRAPFLSAVPGVQVPRPAGEDISWCGQWIFHTQDSLGRPVCLDESGILGMVGFSGDEDTSHAVLKALSIHPRTKGEPLATDEPGPRRP